MSVIKKNKDRRVVSISNFLDTKLRPYSAQSNVRALPFIGDGFKEAQRKALWGILERGENRDDDTVERIAAYACSVSDYHHGAVSMEDTIIRMAQRFSGTNLLPVLVDNGQFGSRKNFDGSQARYLKTKLDVNFRNVFLKEDDCITERLVSGEVQIEPKYFIPCMPLILINGASGVGTGHATEILTYNPKDIASAIKKILNGESIQKHSLVPWFGEDFKGTISKDPVTGQVQVRGVWEFIKKNRSVYLKITELPTDIQGDKYKAMLDELEKDKVILDYDNLSDKNGFEFIVKVPQEVVDLPELKLIRMFKLVANYTENFTVWNPDGKLIRYECAEDLLIDWVAWRIDQYSARFTKQLENLHMDFLWADERRRWISLYLSDPLYFRDNETSVIVDRMKQNNLTRIDDLFAIPMRALTKSKIEELNKQILKIESEIERIKGLDEVKVMISDIRKF